MNAQKLVRPSRRTVLQAGGALVASAAMPRLAFADDQPPIGTWPAGSQGSSITIGAAVPLTGTYAAAGADELKGWQLAVEHLNSGDELIRGISPKTKKGV